MISPIALIPLLVYGIAIAAQSVKIAYSFTRRRIRIGACAAGLLLVVHACYGVGLVTGLVTHRPRPAAFTVTWIEALDLPSTSSMPTTVPQG
jgi:hypothetical protein